ncbi:hypothetical protein [Chenggangzhangella methanolivorans]|uniref:hypothetical protein n=1 Tax=Chenggangzhangella methanolivorans TaxID=1437009 RepID=UPI0021BD9F9B|nr:hypothetical protein [Chenggangzhangella methanolivorans]
MLRPGGAFVAIHRPQALGDILSGLGRGFGDLRIKPIQPRADAPAARLLVAGRKGGRGPLGLLAPFALHGPDGRFTPEADAAQRGESVVELTG